MKKVIAIVALMLLGCALPAQAQPFDKSSGVCGASVSDLAGLFVESLCAMYVVGWLEAIYTLKPAGVCIPMDRLTPEMGMKVLARWAQSHPQEKDNQDARMRWALDAFANEWPCPEKAPDKVTAK
jgi:Rap1a immunity proteins